MPTMPTLDIAFRLERWRRKHPTPRPPAEITKRALLWASLGNIHWLLANLKVKDANAASAWARLILFEAFENLRLRKLSHRMAVAAVARSAACGGAVLGLSYLALGFCCLEDSHSVPTVSESDVLVSQSIEHFKNASAILSDRKDNEYYYLCCLTLLGNALIHMDETEAALEANRAAAAVVERMWSLQTSAPVRPLSRFAKRFYRSRPWTDWCVNSSARVATQLGFRLDCLTEAGDMYNKLIDRLEERYGRLHSHTIVVRRLYAADLAAQSEMLQAVHQYREVRARNRQRPIYCVPCEESLIASHILHCLWTAGEYGELKKEADSMDLLNEVRTIDDGMDAAAATMLYLVRGANVRLGNYAEVVKLCRRFQDFHNHVMGATNSFTLFALEEEWWALGKLGRHRDAMWLARDMVFRESLKNETASSATWGGLRSQWNLARSLAAINQLDESAYEHRRCLEIARRLVEYRNAERKLVRNILRSLACVYEQLGLGDDSAVVYGLVQRSYWSKPYTPRDIAWYYWYRGKMFLAWGQCDEAVSLFTAAASAAVQPDHVLDYDLEPDYLEMEHITPVAWVSRFANDAYPVPPPARRAPRPTAPKPRLTSSRSVEDLNHTAANLNLDTTILKRRSSLGDMHSLTADRNGDGGRVSGDYQDTGRDMIRGEGMAYPSAFGLALSSAALRVVRLISEGDLPGAMATVVRPDQELVEEDEDFEPQTTIREWLSEPGRALYPLCPRSDEPPPTRFLKLPGTYDQFLHERVFRRWVRACDLNVRRDRVLHARYRSGPFVSRNVQRVRGSNRSREREAERGTQKGVGMSDAGA